MTARYAVCTILALLASGWPAAAQNADAYVFAAPGGVTCCGHTDGTLHLGGGGEGIIRNRVGIGAEIGALGPTEKFSEAIGIFSVNGSYHFARSRERKLDPFVTGGYTLAFRQGHANMVNLGGGANVWLHHKVGLRLEFRDHLWAEHDSAIQYWGLRIGAVFR